MIEDSILELVAISSATAWEKKANNGPK